MGKKLQQFIWFEKHRPQQLNDVSLNKEHKKAFSQYLKDGQLPHLILDGPAGSGKTTIANILISGIPCIVRALNASGKEDRSIDTMQTIVKAFAGSVPPKGKIKIVFMDEADGMKGDAQESLKNIMETYSASTRFIMTCNNFDKMIDPIKSRCVRFTFDQFPERKVVNLCQGILEKEEIEGVSAEDLKELVNKFYPDIRSIINNLQNACSSGKFNPKAVKELQADPKVVCDLLLKGHVLSIRKSVAGLTNFEFIYKYFFNEFLKDNGTPQQKEEMVYAIGESCRYSIVVPDREIEFISCCLQIMGALEVTPDFSK